MKTPARLFGCGPMANTLYLPRRRWQTAPAQNRGRCLHERCGGTPRRERIVTTTASNWPRQERRDRRRGRTSRVVSTGAPPFPVRECPHHDATADLVRRPHLPLGADLASTGFAVANPRSERLFDQSIFPFCESPPVRGTTGGSDGQEAIEPAPPRLSRPRLSPRTVTNFTRVADGSSVSARSLWTTTECTRLEHIHFRIVPLIQYLQQRRHAELHMHVLEVDGGSAIAAISATVIDGRA